jgi:predicted permease
MVIAPLLHGDARVSPQTSVRDRARTALRSLWAEVRGAARLAGRQPLFTSLLVVVLTLAIGASVAMFSVLNAVALRPLPYGSPQQLMALWSIRPDGSRGPFTIQDYVDLRERDIGSESVGAFAAWSANLTGVGTAERLQGMRTSANAFGVLRVAAIAGRTFLASDDADGRVVVLGHGLWTRRFGADPAVVGRVLTLNSANYTVVGVLPRGFVFPIRDAEIAVPIVEAEARRVEGDVGFLRLVARLRPDVSRAQAEPLMTAAARELQRLRPETNARKVAIRLVPLHEQIVGDYAITLRLLLGAVLLVLVLACVNLASLSLARTCARQRELAIRAALGVGRFRLAAQLLMETLLPAAVAGAAGLVLAAWQTRLLLALAPAAMPRANDVTLDLPVVLFGIGATLATGVAVGLWPAIRMSRIDPADHLRGLGRAAGASQSLTIRRGLVAAEVAISLVLAVSTALFVQSLRRVQEVAPGFASERVLSMRLSLSRERYKDRSEVLAFQERLQTRLRALPGVEAVGGTSLIPLSGMQAFAAAARAALAEADPDVPAASVRTLEQAIDATLAARRFNAWIVALFGYAALALTACGIYAVSAHAVAARSRELGIRAALGASPRGLVALVLRTDFAAVVLGLVGGLLVARAVASALGGLLFDVRAGDPGPYAAVTILLALVGATACYVPASRAARSDPLRAIRND